MESLVSTLVMLLWLQSFSIVNSFYDDAYRFRRFAEFYEIEEPVKCYTDIGKPQMCSSAFVNAAYLKNTEATNTCGEFESETFCQRTALEVQRLPDSCSVCDAHSFPASHLTDLHIADKRTWWQSSTMKRNINYPNTVNLTIDLGRAFEITYVKIAFHLSRPESYAIYKKTSADGPWIPYQFYSESCQSTYGMPKNEKITKKNENRATCTSAHSGVTPLVGDRVTFSTLEGRPSGPKFHDSPMLQEWVTATHIRIVLNRINTLGDQAFKDSKTLQSYYYAIYDIAIGGKCKCNGHASKCVDNNCICEHNTTGPNCESCQSFFIDRPWKRATRNDANECRPCNCNGHSEMCYFDEDLYQRTGHGGHCRDCRDNTHGPHCERCQSGYYKMQNREVCRSCGCDVVGSRGPDCNERGVCQCKYGVTGDKCDRCLPQYFSFGPDGCRTCECMAAGCLNNNPSCLDGSGECRCKENVQGVNCDVCKPGYFGLDLNNPLGCLPCYCYGHTNKCTMSPGYFLQYIHSDFRNGVQGWKGVSGDNRDVPLQFEPRLSAVGIGGGQDDSHVYFSAPDRYLGDQKNSYDLHLTFDLQLNNDEFEPSPSDVIVEGVNGRKFYAPLTSQGNPSPRSVKQSYKFRLSEHHMYEWGPGLSSREFVDILSGVQSIRIRGAYSRYGGQGYLSNVKLESSAPSYGHRPATNVERCDCPTGYVGQFCEACAPGYRKEMGGTDPKERCVGCECHGHSDSCDSNSGHCFCQHNTAGPHCERCAPGYYGDALRGTPSDCKPCPCLNNGECVELGSGEVVCTKCQMGYTGKKCGLCDDGYHGDPLGTKGPKTPCRPCQCNENVDPNAIGNCDRWTGECRKCLYNTAGFNCERCLPNHHGDALAHPKGQCKSCHCYLPGTVSQHGAPCDLYSGQCVCQPNVIGLKCDKCVDGYWNIDSHRGCERCQCNPIGSLDTSCDPHTGQCRCKPGVGGVNCDGCEVKYYGFSQTGCTACNCNPEGSRHEQCDVTTGWCLCRPNIEGRACDRCSENRYLDERGTCIECPECYRQVQRLADEIRVKVNDLRILVQRIISGQSVGDDSDLRNRVHLLNHSIVTLWLQARSYRPGSGGNQEDINRLRLRIEELTFILNQIVYNLEQSKHSNEKSRRELVTANRLLDEMEAACSDYDNRLNDARMQLLMLRERMYNHGQRSEQLRRMAFEARQLAERHDTESRNIQQTIDQALRTSQNALRIAQSITPGSAGGDYNIYIIRRRLGELEEEKTKTSSATSSCWEDSTRALNEAGVLLAEINDLRVTSYDETHLQHEINNLKIRADRIRDEWARITGGNERFLDDIDSYLKKSFIIINSLTTERQNLDEMFGDADSLYHRATEAVTSIHNLYHDANRTLYILLHYDEEMQIKGRLAEEAQKKIPSIENKINNANRNIYQAQITITNAERSSRDANKRADETLLILEEAFKKLEEIEREAVQTHNSSLHIVETYEQDKTDVQRITDKLDALEDQAKNDKANLAQAADSTENVIFDADHMQTRLDELYNDLHVFLDSFSSQQGLDVNNIEQAYIHINSIESRLSTWFNKFEEIKKYDSHLNIWLMHYQDILNQLALDIANMQHISVAIPEQCFKIAELEVNQR